MWEPGQSGNPSGKSPEKPFKDQILKLCKQEDYKRLHAAAGKLLEAASNGEPWAIQMLADRTDGKPAQQTELTGLNGGAIIIQASGIDEAT